MTVPDVMLNSARAMPLLLLIIERRICNCVLNATLKRLYSVQIPEQIQIPVNVLVVLESREEGA
jgi:hypothetical protein